MENAKKGYNYMETGYVTSGAKTAVDAMAAQLTMDNAKKGGEIAKTGL
jgi:hypothetical protein